MPEHLLYDEVDLVVDVWAQNIQDMSSNHSTLCVAFEICIVDHTYRITLWHVYQ
jgi:hypothetical protein